MATILLIIIYASFISLGLPDSLFGVTWPVAHGDLSVPLSYASPMMIIVGLCTASMSMFAGRMIRRFGTGLITAISVLMTAVALVCISLSPSVWWMLLWMALLGLGAGAVDVGLNEYVAAHYKAQHMNWLHCFWGIGVTVSPLIMSRFLADGSWRSGYRVIALIQGVYALLLFCALPLWERVAKMRTPPESPGASPLPPPNVRARPIRTPGVGMAMLMLAFYCGLEYIVGTWGASFLIQTRGIDAARAATWVSLYYGGIMLSRLLAGFTAMRLSDKALIQLGLFTITLGAIFLTLPLGSGFALTGLLLIGVGCGPVFPCTIHATVARFGKTFSADIVGLQMGGAYVGMLVLQPLFGYIATHSTFFITPYVLFGLALLQLWLLAALEARIKKARIG